MDCRNLFELALNENDKSQLTHMLERDREERERKRDNREGDWELKMLLIIDF